MSISWWSKMQPVKYLTTLYKITLYGLMISIVLVENIILYSFRVDNVYALNLDHISAMHLSCLKHPLIMHSFGIVG